MTESEMTMPVEDAPVPVPDEVPVEEPIVAPALPGEAGIRKTGNPEADAEALAAYPYAELKQYAVDVGVEPAKSKAETIERILGWMYPPIRGHVSGVVEPGQVSARIARIQSSQG